MNTKNTKLAELLTDRQSKDTTTKSRSLNEAVNFKVALDGLSDKIADTVVKKEKQAASKFKWVPNSRPVTIDKVSGNMSDGQAELTLNFSNADKIYYNDNGKGRSYSMIFVGPSDSYKVSQSMIDKALGYASTTVGGVALIYSIFKNGKKSSHFSKY